MKRLLERYLPRAASRLRAARAALRGRADLRALRRRFERARAAGGLAAPRVVSALHHEITERCNLDCGVCYQRERRASARAKPELSAAELAPIYRALRPRRVVLVGSEVLLHPEFFELAAELDQLGCELHLISNGTLIDERAAERLLALRGLRSAILSIDGPAPVHDALRGCDGAHARTLAALELLRAGVDLALHCVLQPGNLESAHEVLDQAAGLGIASVHFGFLFTQEAAAARATLARLEESLGWNPEEVSLALTQRAHLGFELEELRAAIARIEERARRLGLHPAWDPPQWREHLELYHGGRAREVLHLACRDLLFPEDLRVNAAGHLIPCPFIHKSLGDLRGTAALAAAGGEERRAFGRLLIEDNLLPICARCCRAVVLGYRPGKGG